MNALNLECGHDKCVILVCLDCDKPVWSCNAYSSMIRKKAARCVCIPCHKQRGRVWRATNNNQQISNWKRRGVITDFTSDDYERMLKDQDGKCAICEGLDPQGRALALDHDHETGKVRGLLCHPCNSVLGYMKDNPSLLLKAAQYLIDRGGSS